MPIAAAVSVSVRVVPATTVGRRVGGRVGAPGESPGEQQSDGEQRDRIARTARSPRPSTRSTCTFTTVVTLANTVAARDAEQRRAVDVRSAGSRRASPRPVRRQLSELPGCWPISHAGPASTVRVARIVITAARCASRSWTAESAGWAESTATNPSTR